MDLAKGNISISGTSSNRQALITFKQNLEVFSEVSAVNIPISSFEKEIDLEFNMGFHFGPGETVKSDVKLPGSDSVLN